MRTLLPVVALATVAAGAVAAFLAVSRRDAVALLVPLVLLLFVLPARLVLPGLGAAGSPANVLAFLLALTWLAARLLPSQRLAIGPQPIRTAVVVYGTWTLVAYAAAQLRPMTRAETLAADRALISLVAVCGVALLVAEGVAHRRRLDTLLWWVVGAACVTAAIGAVQALTAVDPVSYLRVPGLVENTAIKSVKTRSIFARPFSTTSHPIEYGVVLAMILPVALHLASTGRTAAGRAVGWAATALVASGVFLSVSRSAILALVAGLALAALGWSWRRRLNMATAGALLLGALYFTVPGLLGTIRSAFLYSGVDPSVQGRVSDFGPVLEAVAADPVAGIGPRTYIPELYRFLDNQYYATAIEQGIVGLATLVFLFAAGLVIARRVGRATADPATRQLGWALAGGIAAALVTTATFDSLSFPVFTMLLFLYLGCVGALYRLHVTRDEPVPYAVAPRLGRPGVPSPDGDAPAARRTVRPEPAREPARVGPPT